MTTTWSVKTSGSTSGEKVLLVANEKGQWDIPVDQLGFTSEQLTQLKKLTTTTTGLVIVTGPRASGRTTTIYAMLRQHDAFTNSVQTLELNPQTEIEGATISKYENRPDASYSKTLQSIFLKDPNVMMVSQVPDPQTAELITKYTTGTEPHQPFIRRFLRMTRSRRARHVDVGQQQQERGGGAGGRGDDIIAQRLVRILCPTCKIPYQPDEATMKKLNLPVGRNLQSCPRRTRNQSWIARGNRIACARIAPEPATAAGRHCLKCWCSMTK